MRLRPETAGDQALQYHKLTPIRNSGSAESMVQLGLPAQFYRLH